MWSPLTASLPPRSIGILAPRHVRCRGVEFPQAGACARESRAHRPDRNPESDCGVLVAELGPGAEREDLLLAAGQTCEQSECTAPSAPRRRSARRCRPRSSAPSSGGGTRLQRRRVASLGATAVPNDVRGDPVRATGAPSRSAAACFDSPPRLEEDDRDEILGDGPAPDAAEAVVVDRPRRVARRAVPKASESPDAGPRPENGVIEVHCPFMSDHEGRVPDEAAGAVHITSVSTSSRR